jgi:hypothetical protein
MGRTVTVLMTTVGAVASTAPLLPSWRTSPGYGRGVDVLTVTVGAATSTFAPVFSAADTDTSEGALASAVTVTMITVGASHTSVRLCRRADIGFERRSMAIKAAGKELRIFDIGSGGRIEGNSRESLALFKNDPERCYRVK